MTELITLIALGWLTNILVKFWIDNLRKYPRIQTLKPFSCQLCLGFWIGCLNYYYLPIYQIIIFASLTSLSAVALNGIVNYLNKP